ncbi:MAG TPA: hypothetical protein VMV17_07375 [Streptosporangiaceae bacterium]|nr:hypothetical protein [Streptosporangiaceae bacterium]
MEFEIWASDSGNRLFATAYLHAALNWALDYWLREGNAAVDVLSVGDSEGRWVRSGQPLRNLLCSNFWNSPPAWETSASDHHQETSALLAPTCV